MYYVVCDLNLDMIKINGSTTKLNPLINLNIINDTWSLIFYLYSDREECMALNVLHQWQEFPICGCALVPEHIERRPLFNVTRPGLEQV